MHTYSFTEQLAMAESYEANPVWEWVYANYFPDFQYMSATIAGPSPQQSLGRDRSIMLAMGNTVTVDEKVSRYTSDAMFLEYWSDIDRGKPGWICDPCKEADYVAYLWANEGIARVLPYRELRKAWDTKAGEWTTRHRCRTVRSREGSRSWTSEGCIVPVVEILEAISDESVIVLPKHLQEDAKNMCK